MRYDQAVWLVYGACIGLVVAWTVGVLVAVVLADRPAQVSWQQGDTVLTADLRWRKMRNGWLVVTGAVYDQDGHVMYGRIGLNTGGLLLDPYGRSRIGWLAVRQLGKRLVRVEWVRS